MAFELTSPTNVVITNANPRRKVHKTVKSIDVDLIAIKNDPFPG